VSPVSGPADRAGGDRPYLTVVRGDASAEEVAALVAVLAALAARRPGAPTRGGERAGGWASRPSLLRRPLGHGPCAWRASGRPGGGLS
jgi:acyl-CoA carboxylase epsilon subunit